MPRAPDSRNHHHRVNCPEVSFLTKRTAWLQGLFTRLIIIIYFYYLRHTVAHPQCLDYRPPFKPPYHLEFCRHYEKFGCCDQKTDNNIATRYWDIMDLIGEEEYAVCGDLVKDIMCQVCLIFCEQLWWHFNCVTDVLTCFLKCLSCVCEKILIGYKLHLFKLLLLFPVDVRLHLQ